MAGIATSTHETSISIQIEREKMMRVLGDEDMPENFDFGGMSGGPVLAIVQTPTLRSWIPAGVIFQGPNPSGDPAESIQGLELIRARPVHFINPTERLISPAGNRVTVNIDGSTSVRTGAAGPVVAKMRDSATGTVPNRFSGLPVYNVSHSTISRLMA
jgi:hypothetical protein